jgi:hypothetical protein
MRIFAPERMRFLTGGWPEEEPVETGFISRTIERAQEKVEVRNFGIRKHTLNYDNVMNEQRAVVYSNRRRVLMGEDVHDSILGMLDRVVNSVITGHTRQASAEDELDLEELCSELRDAVPGLAERMAVEAVATEIAELLPSHLAAAAADRLIEERQWLARLVERAAREAAVACADSLEARQALAAEVNALIPGGAGLVPADFAAPDVRLDEIEVGRVRAAWSAREATVAEGLEGLRAHVAAVRVPPPEDPVEGQLPDLEPACREAAGALREARAVEVRSVLEHVESADLTPERQTGLRTACAERLRGIEQENGLAETLAADGLGRTVADILSRRGALLYEDELQWHVRALERRLDAAIKAYADPDKEMAEWDLEALARDSEQIVPGTAEIVANAGAEVQPYEYPGLVRRSALQAAESRDPAQSAQRRDSLAGRIATAVRSATPTRTALQAWDVEILFRKAGEAESEARATLAQEAARRVHGSRLGAALKDPAVAEYARRAEGVRGSWGLRRSLAIDALGKLPPAKLPAEIRRRALALHKSREERLGAAGLRQLERSALLRAIEASWPQHLQDMDHLREAVHLRAYGQWDPLVQYQKEAFQYFQRLLDRIAQDVTRLVLTADFVPRPVQRRVQRADVPGVPLPVPGDEAVDGAPRVRPEKLPHPNKRCWCGSGRKYRNCHMAADQAELVKR